MRVAMVGPRDGGAGTPLGRHVAELARSVAGAGHAVEVVACGRGPSSARQLRGLDRFDVVHVHGARTLAALLATRPVLPFVVVTPHLERGRATRIDRVVGPVHRRLGAPALSCADVVICTSAVEAERLARLAPAAAPRTHVVPEGTDVAAIRAALPVEPRPLGRVVLAAGRSGAGADRLISALPALTDGFVLAIAGDGPHSRALRAHAADLAVERRVRFLGRMGEGGWRRWLRTADVVASMAEDPASARRLLEARAAGAPVVASDVATHREAAELLGGGIHLVSPQASPLALADVLAAVASSPASGAGDAIPTWADVADLTLALYARHLELPAAEPLRVPAQWSVA